MNDKIFSPLLSKRFGDEIASWVTINGITNFFKDTNLPKLKNKKANKTLLTYMYEYANEFEGTQSISYMLCGSMRSHKINSDIHLPISTQIYLKPIINSENIKSVSYSLLKRGFFGWIPYKLLEIAFDDDKFKELDLNQVTNMIVNLRECYGLFGLEAIAEHINIELHQKGYIKMFSELIGLSKDQLKARMKEILTGESSSKHKNSGCLKGKICVYPNRDSCILCEYFVKNVYFLYYVNEEIIDILDKIKVLDESKKNEQIKFSKILFGLLNIVSEAQSFYSKYDSKFINAFIDIEKIKNKINFIKDKLIITEGI